MNYDQGTLALALALTLSTLKLGYLDILVARAIFKHVGSI